MPYSLFLSIATAAVWLAACTSTSRPLATVPAVDLDRYYGRWYEIARLPNRFQAMCVSDTQATYRPDGNTVAVLNQCRTATGLEQAKGIAKVVAGSRGARLTFIRSKVSRGTCRTPRKSSTSFNPLAGSAKNSS